MATPTMLILYDQHPVKIFSLQMFLTGLSLPCLLFHQLPASLQLLCLSFVTQLASVVGESAENYTNECRERSVDTRDSSKNRNNNNNNVVTRRRRRS